MCIWGVAYSIPKGSSSSALLDFFIAVTMKCNLWTMEPNALHRRSIVQMPNAISKPSLIEKSPKKLLKESLNELWEEALKVLLEVQFERRFHMRRRLFLCILEKSLKRFLVKETP